MRSKVVKNSSSYPASDSRKTIRDACFSYIGDYWEKVTCLQNKDNGVRIGLPNKFICPNDKIFLNDQFYWDTYFIILGLISVGKNRMAKGMAENLTHLFQRFGLVPMRNKFYNTGTSQIPFLTSIIGEVYNALKDKQWLGYMMKIAESELNDYWLNETLTENHTVGNGMLRYCDHFLTHSGAEQESGWDMTSRFHGKCLNFVPVDLNCCIYKYERDLSVTYGILGNKKKSASYARRASLRAARINRILWNEKKAFYFDLDYVNDKQSGFWSVAGFYPLWAGVASAKVAREIVKRSLLKFEYRGGIANSRNKFLEKPCHQHDFPNGWPNQQYIVIQGLLNYGFTEDAHRLAHKWMQLTEDVFESSGKLWEKYNVVDCSVGISCSGRYETQPGFGWTNAIYLWMHRRFRDYTKSILRP